MRKATALDKDCSSMTRALAASTCAKTPEEILITIPMVPIVSKNDENADGK